MPVGNPAPTPPGSPSSGTPSAPLSPSASSSTSPSPARSPASPLNPSPLENNGTSPPSEKKLSLAELFADDSEDASAPLDDDPAKPVDSLDGAARRLKMTPEQIYALKVPMSNGAEALTIGTLKDRVGELVDLDTRQLQFDQRRVSQEGELLRAQTELREVLAMLPKQALSPELVNKVRTQQDTILKRERASTLEMIPEWRDDEKRTTEITGMIEHLKDYGFNESFLTTIHDHRALKYIRDNWLRDQRIKKALANVTIPDKKPGQRPSAKGVKPPVNPGAPRSTSTRRSGTPDMAANLMSIFKNAE